MTASEKVTKIINEFESVRFVAYWDGTYTDRERTQKRWTLGWGTTRYPDGKLVAEGDTCTLDQANVWRDADITAHCGDLNDALFRVIEDWDADATTYQNMYDALVDFSYNAGIGHFKQSTLRLRLEEGRKNDAAEEFLKWTMVDGKRSNGLLRRRLAERALFLSEFKSDGTLKMEKSDFPDAQWYPAV